MTYREKLMQEHPERVDGIRERGCAICPDRYGYEDWSECDNAGGNCVRCWNRKIPEEVKKDD